MSLLASLLYLFSSSSFSMVRRAKTVELFPAPKMLAMKLRTIEDMVCGFFT